MIEVNRTMCATMTDHCLETKHASLVLRNIHLDI